MIETAKTFRHWKNEIYNSFLTYGLYNKKTSNGFIEGKNRLVKEIKAFSCGFNNFAIYRARILYINSKTPLAFTKKDGLRKLYSKSKKKLGIIDSSPFQSPPRILCDFSKPLQIL